MRPKKALQGPPYPRISIPFRGVLYNIMIDIHNAVGDDGDTLNFRTYSDAQQTGFHASGMKHNPCTVHVQADRKGR